MAIKLCIYTRKTEADGANFIEQEHILSAGLGGKTCLEKGVVSDEVNALFSIWETQFLRYSPISILRQFYGPGKRGKMNPKNATKSVVNVSTTIDQSGEEDLNDVGLCYVQLGEPYVIPALRISKDHFTIVAKSTDDWEPFLEHLKKCPENDFKIVPYDNMPISVALLGFHDGKWHLARGSELELDYVIEVLQMIKSGTVNVLTSRETEFYTTSHQELTYNEIVYSKVIGKFAFNFLAYCIGQVEILREEFNPIRNWIISDLLTSIPEHHFVKVVEAMEESPIPNLAHAITIFKENNNLLGMVDLYGGTVKHLVLLAKEYEHDFIPQLLVCDWENQDEFFETEDGAW